MMAATNDLNPPLLRFLGDADPFGVLEQTERALRASVAGLTDTELRRAEKPSKWSVIEVVQHLADCEVSFGYRFRAVIAESGPKLSALDADAWASGLGYRERSLPEALAEFAAGRAGNLRVLKRTSERDREEKFGIHAERGAESLAKMIRIYAAHDLCHLAQIDRVKNAIGATRD